MKAWKCGFLQNGHIALIELDIPETADKTERCTVDGLEMGRCSFADVLTIKEIIDNGNKKDNQQFAVSAFNFNFKYVPGIRVFPDAYNKIEFIQCTNGIHYFKSEDDAFAYSRTDYWFNNRRRDYILSQRIRKLKNKNTINEDIVICITTNGENY